jgi:hypothetical protein
MEVPCDSAKGLNKNLWIKNNIVHYGFIWLMVKISFILEVVALAFCLSVPSLSTAMVVSNPPMRASSVTAFHVNFTGPTWAVFNISLSETTNLSFHCSSDFFLNESRYWDLSMVGEQHNGSYMGSSLCGGVANQYDRYFQFRLGPFNWSRYTSEPNHGEAICSIGNKEWNTTGNYTFTLVAYGPDCSADVWINLSKNASITYTSGSEVFALERQNLGGNLNLGWKHGTLILNGKAEITIQNNLYCCYMPYAYSCRGYERISYRTPSGTSEWLTQINGNRDDEPTIENSPGFFDTLKFEEKGTWTFYANMLAFGRSAYKPNIILFGADVKMP